MRYSAYRKKVEQDLDLWIGNGWVPADNRDKILASLPARNPGDGRSWIVMVASILAGLAVIAFIADNWSAMPRGLKLIILLSAFLGSTLYAAFTQTTNRKLSNALSLLGSLIFAGSVALIGQAYNMQGEPKGVVIVSALAATVIGLTGRSPAAGFAGFVFSVIWIGMSDGELDAPWLSTDFWLLNCVAGGLAAIAWMQKSRALWHCTIIAGLGLSFLHIHEATHLLSYGALELSDHFTDNDEPRYRIYMSLATLMFGGLSGFLGWVGYKRDHAEQTGGLTLLGYTSWAALGSVAMLALPMEEIDFLHRLIWLAASIFVLWFGARERYGWVAAGGIVSLLSVISVIFVDLGLELSSAALLFAISALVSLAIVFWLKRRANTGEVQS